ncbi:MAG: hypothetical protein ACPL3P_09310 [Anaerolineales bacterium]
MKRKIATPFSFAIAALAGVIVLLGYFVDFPLVSQFRASLLQIALILGAVALMMGVFNMARVHWMQLRKEKGNALIHITFYIGLIGTLLLGGWLGIGNPLGHWLYEGVVIPVEASLMAVMAISLTYLLTKIVNRRKDLPSIVFLITVLLGLLSAASFLGQNITFLSGENALVKSLLQLVSNGAMRGILIGVALGSIATGLRVLFGSDKPYGG